jgi:glycine/D-amino acid oxidase-like deaminating enzyme
MPGNINITNHKKKQIEQVMKEKNLLHEYTMHGFPQLSILSQLAFLPSNGFPLLRFDPRPELAQLALAKNSEDSVRIGIIGGGIAGVSVAHALSKRLSIRPDHGVKIVVLEGSMPPVQPAAEHWEAATANNGNSLVPGVSFHIFSRPGALYQVFVDTAREFIELKLGSLFKSTPLEPRHDDFQVVPPYFALHLGSCLGFSATSDERWSFIHFVQNYLYYTMWLGKDAADQRADTLYRLAKANRCLYLEDIKSNKMLSEKVGHSQGFLSLYRTKKEALKGAQHLDELGEENEILEWDQVLKLEPRLSNLPMQPLYAVRRSNDYTASCEAFIRHWITETTAQGVEYQTAKVETLALQKPSETKKRFTVGTSDGSSQEFDYLVLAAGIQTPLLASQLDLTIPVYPLRGFSLNIGTWHPGTKEIKKRNLLGQPFKIDSMYCSSTGPWTARWVGFGEFCGYRKAAESVPSVGPSILARYAKSVFPDAVTVQESEAFPCFRPWSPDDLPIVGETSQIGGLFLHTGHGSLGWTIGLTTGDCVAQAIESKLNGDKHESFLLADKSRIERDELSPNRFVHNGLPKWKGTTKVQ